MTAINFPSSPSNGDTFVAGSVTYTYNSTKQYWDALPTAPLNTNFFTGVDKHITPGTDNTYDLGSTSHKWRSLYVDAGTIHIGSQTIKATGSGIQLPELTIGTGTTTVKLGVAADGSVTQTSTVSGTAAAATTSVALTDLSVTSASASGGGALAYASATGAFTYTPPDLTVKAPLDAPTFTGVPAAPTASAATNTTQLATTAFVATAVAGIVDTAPATLNTLNEIAAALGDDANYATTTTTAIGLKAPLAAPTFTGVPAAPTASVGTNTTQLATTAFVTAATAGSGGSGGSIDLVADGTIAAGKAVTIEAGTGKVKQVGAPTIAFDFDTLDSNTTDSSTFDRMGYYNKTNDRFFVFGMHSAGDGEKFISYNGQTGAVDVNTTQSIINDSYHMGGFEILSGGDAGKHVVFSSNGANSGNPYDDIIGSVITIGAGSLSAGAEQDFTAITGVETRGFHSTQGKTPGVWDQTSDVGIIVCGDEDTSGVDGNIYVCAFSISSGTVTPGTGTKVQATGDSTSAGAMKNSGEDKANISIAYSATAGKAYVFYINASTQLVARGLTISGTTITLDAEQVLHGSWVRLGLEAAFSETGDTWAVTGIGTGSTYSTAGRLVIKSGKISSSGSMTASSNLQDLPSGGSGTAVNRGVFGISCVPGTDKFTVASPIGISTSYTGDRNQSAAIAATHTTQQTFLTINSDGSANIRTPQTRSGVNGYRIYEFIPAKGPVHKYMHIHGGGPVKVSFGNYHIEGNSNNSEWIGINTVAKTDGQTATVTLPGGINENQSGMTIEGAYYVQANGDITTVTTDYKAGIALTAGKILVDDNTVNGATSLSAYATTSALTTGLAAKAPLAAPTFTGVPAAPTASAGTNTTQLATTAFVTAATAGSGGGIALVANGAIAAGKAVVIDTGGTVSQVSNPADFLQTSEQVGPTTTYNSNGGHTFYNKVKNRHVTLTAANSGTAYVTAFTRSGTTLSYGAVVNVTNNDNYTTYGAPYLIIDNVTGREFIIKASQDGIVYYSELGGTGNTVSVGGQQQIWNPGISDQHTTAFASGSKAASFGGGEFMFSVFTRATTGATVFTISTISMVIAASGVPTFGTPTQIGATNGFKIINDGGGLKIIEDAVDNTKGLIQYHDTSNALKMSAVTFSGTGTSRTISAIGTAISSIDNQNSGMATICNIKGLEDKFMAVQRSGSAAKAAVVSVSGTTATLNGSVTVLDTASTADLPGDIISSSANDGEVISWNQASGYSTTAGAVYVRPLQVSGNTITMGTNQLVKTFTSLFHGSNPANTSYHAGYSISAEVDDNPGVYILVHGTPGGGTGSYQKKAIAYPYGVNQLSNRAEWVGISKAAAADGATVTIDVPGDINAQQSGMTIEGTYYVQNDGDIETGVTTEVAGVALSATKLLVADNTTNSQANIPLSSYATTATVNAKAPLASPTFTGVPAAPTASVGTNTTQLATTAFVLANGGGTAYTAISSATTAVAGNAYVVDTGAAVTVTLPASATFGDTVAVIDGTGTAATNNITIGRNSHKIQGDAADMTVSLNRAAFELVYYNATHGWLLTKV